MLAFQMIWLTELEALFNLASVFFFDQVYVEELKPTFFHAQTMDRVKKVDSLEYGRLLES